MNIERATLNDIEAIMSIFRQAVKYMHANGNPNQWSYDYPSREAVEYDIALDRFYIIRDDKGDIVAQFCYFVGEEPTYAQIDGAWLNDKSYGVVHRLASSGTVRGIADICLNWCYTQHPNIRIDTHADNKIMQTKLRQHAYRECGVITVSNGSKRIAFQK